MKLRRLSLVLLVVLLSGGRAVRGEDAIKHSFFIAGPSFTGIIDEEGRETWDSGKAGARDGFVLSNGNVLIAWGDEVKEFTRDKQVVFRFARTAQRDSVRSMPVHARHRATWRRSPAPWAWMG